MACHALVTGSAGFIGSHVSEMLLKEGWHVTGIDNLDPYYDPDVKLANLAVLSNHEHFRFVEADILDYKRLISELDDRFDVIIHLAAKVGVRPSIKEPLAYCKVNIQGTQNMLELARLRNINQFIFASSSSVYGTNPNVPWSENDHVLQPISPYACTKVSGELLGHVYSHLYGIRFIGLRFFTVYGPRQRPDLAINKFIKLMLDGRPIPVYGDGLSLRDYTYIDDIVNGIHSAIIYTASPYEIFNLGSTRPFALRHLIQIMGKLLEIEPVCDYLPEQAGDVSQTWADVTKASMLLGYRPAVELEEGIRRYLDWLDRPFPAKNTRNLPDRDMRYV